MSEFIPFSVPEISNEEINEVVDTLRSGWITTGPKVKQFESDFQEFIGGGVEATVEPADDPVERARENLVHVLMNHHDFVTVR